MPTRWKCPKGTFDLVGTEYDRITDLTNLIERIFRQNGGQPLETPIFERRDVLLGKYGEEADTKLIFNLEDQGGELLSLRYDQTLPFVRYIQENGIDVMRRYSIGKVYRRDQPNKGQGRFREFIQADFDIVGERQSPMMAEGLLLSMASQILQELGVEYTIYLNSVKNIRTILIDRLGVPEALFRKLTPLVDKLDKCSFDSLKPEFTAVCPFLDLDRLRSYLEQTEPEDPQTALDITILRNIAQVFGFNINLRFTNTLARGLDYYTGLIYEIKAGVDGSGPSLVAGGRYELIPGKSMVGISFGVSRMVALIPSLTSSIPQWNNEIRVTTVGNVDILDKLRVVRRLQETYTSAVVRYELLEKDPKLNKVLQNAVKNYVRYVAIVAEDELITNQSYILKNLQDKTQIVCSL